MAFLEELGKTLTDTGKEVATKAKALTETIQLRRRSARRRRSWRKPMPPSDGSITNPTVSRKRPMPRYTMLSRHAGNGSQPWRLN